MDFIKELNALSASSERGRELHNSAGYRTALHDESKKRPLRRLFQPRTAVSLASLRSLPQFSRRIPPTGGSHTGQTAFSLLQSFAIKSGYTSFRCS